MRHIILGIALLTVLFEGYGAKTFVGKVSGIESKEPFTAPKMAPPRFSKNSFNVKDFGAKGDSTTNDTQAINKAIETCNAKGGGSLIFPAGRYIAASIHLKSNVCFRLDDKAEIYGAASGYDAPEPHDPFEKYQDYGHSHFHNALMWGEGIENFAIIGGKVTGGPIIQGDPKGRDIGDKVIVIVKGKNLLFKNVTHDTGGHFVYLLNDCENITLDHVVIKKSRDAVDFMGCRNVQVFGCHFTGCSDDTIGIKSDFVLGRRILSENIYVWDCYFESGCNGLQFGSETAGDFRNIRIWSVKIALSMKAGIGITSNDSGIIEDVQYRDIEVTNAACPIFILITDRLRTGEPNVHPGKIKDVTIKNVTFSKHKAGSHHGPASTATISGLPGFTIDNLTLENIKMTNSGGGTLEDAKAIPPYLKEYSPNQYKTRPAAAFFIRHVKNLTLNNVEMAYETPDMRPPLVIWDATGVTLDNFNSPRPEGVEGLSLKDVTGLTVVKSEGKKTTTDESVKEGTSMKSFLKPAIKEGGFRMEGYFLWCPSVIKVGDTYHLFCSRWPESVGMGGWTTWSECVRATSKNLFGPYQFEEVVLQKRDSTKWDKNRVHNVKILKIGSKYVLYYISTKMNTGYACADKITGPWTRIDQPAMHVTNPAVLVRPDNSIYVIGRGEGPNKTNIATAFTAPSFDGVYTILKDGNNVLPQDFELEDPTIWWANNQYNILVNDWKAKATGLSKGGAQYYSKDGLSYTLISKEPVFTKTVEFDDNTTETFNRRERPSVYVNDKGEVVALFTTCLPSNGPARIIIQPVDKYYPKN